MIISSLDNPKVKEITKLKNRKYRNASNLFLVEGLHLVLEAYKNKALVELLLEEGQVLPLDLKTSFYTKELMQKMSDLENSPGIMGICKKKESKKELGSKILILDDLIDPSNLGLIIRSALAFGVDTLVLSPKTVDLYNPKVVRATQGMIFALNIITTELEEFILKLKKDNYTIYGTTVELASFVDTLKKEEKEKFALIMGNEARGVSRTLLDLSDKNLHIRMNKEVESLNVAVATSILLYELSK